jgi:D-isomer specific 2-hydroxyacid dehydrogenase-like protein
MNDAAAVVSLHVPANDATRNMIDAAALFSMKPNAYPINVARGPPVRNELLGNELSIILKQPRERVGRSSSADLSRSAFQVLSHFSALAA